MDQRKLLVLGAILGGILAVRRLRPSGGRGRLMERLMERMPPDSPPRLVRSILPRLREQNEEIIALLREQNELLRQRRSEPVSG
jgi:hypothetical protein